MAEVDHPAGARSGGVVREAWGKDLRAGADLVEWWSGVERQSVEITASYQRFGVDRPYFSLVTLADRLETCQLATLGVVHFLEMLPLTHKDAVRIFQIVA